MGWLRCCPKVSLCTARRLAELLLIGGDDLQSTPIKALSDAVFDGQEQSHRLCCARCLRIWQRLAKASPALHQARCQRVQEIAVACAVGFAIMGFIGYTVKLVFTPINNIIIGGS